MSSITSLISSFVLMIIMLVIGYIFPYIILPAEIISIEFAKIGVSNVSPEWSSFADGVFYIKLMYFIGYGIMFIGVMQFVLTAIRKESQENVYYYQ